MIVLIFGVTNVGKSVTGKLLSEKLGYMFCDLDLEIMKYFNFPLDEFQAEYPISYERGIQKRIVLDYLIKKYKDNLVIAISPIYYASIFESLLSEKDIFSIELQDSVEHIFDRLIFSDENDNLYKDDEYKNEHKDYYLNDINEDIIYCKEVFKKIENKYYMNNKQPIVVVQELMEFIESKLGTKI